MQIRVVLRKGGLEAVAALAEGPLDLESAVAPVLEQLSQLGVQPLPTGAQLQVALAPLGEAEPPAAGVVVTRGTPPQQGIGAQLLPLFPVRATPPQPGEDPLLSYCHNVVYPGDCILERTPPSPGIPGRSLLGVEIPAPPGNDIAVQTGPGVRSDEEGRRFLSETYGVVLFHNQQLQVVPALRLADNFMAAHLTVLPDGRLDEAGQVAKVVAALQTLGVTRGLRSEILLTAVRQARAEAKPVADVLVAQGKPPQDGREIDFELLMDANQKVGKELEGGRIDFREAESVKNVHRGEQLARVIPAIEPQQGMRVDGEMLRPKMVRAQGLKPGQNTILSEDGAVVLADGDGMLVVQGGKFHIADQYLVNGNVDYTTGNIRATGSVTIRGQVAPGFEVEAGKAVEIMGDVDNAKVSTAGSLTVRGGITAGSVVKAAQNLTAKYIQASTVEAGGDLDVKLSVTNSAVYVRGQVTVTGSQGAIVGGEVNAALGIQARDIGSPAAKTHVAVGVDLRVLRELEEITKEREGSKKALAHLQASLGRAFLKDPRGTLAAIPASLRKPKLEMLQKMQELFVREKVLAARDAELQMLKAEVRNAQITVQGTIHAGTVITISQLRHVLKETLRRVVISYDAVQNQVTWKRL